MNKTPTVTELLSILNKPALLNWANRIGLQGTSLEEHNRKSKAKGNTYHDQIEKMIKLNKEIEDSILRKNYHAFFDGSDILESEKNVSCEHWKGRYDIKFMRDNKTYLCDFKSNAKGVYLENKLQLIAYAYIENVDCIGIISLPDVKMIEVKVKDAKPYIGILRALSHIYKCKRQINNG